MDDRSPKAKKTSKKVKKYHVVFNGIIREFNSEHAARRYREYLQDLGVDCVSILEIGLCY